MYVVATSIGEATRVNIRLLTTSLQHATLWPATLWHATQQLCTHPIRESACIRYVVLLHGDRKGRATKMESEFVWWMAKIFVLKLFC